MGEFPSPQEKPAIDQEVQVGQEIFDAEWYAEFVQIGSFQAYEYLDDAAKSAEQPEKSRRQAAKEDFLADAEHQANPQLEYPKLDEAWINEREAKLLDLKDRIASTEKNPVVRQTYRWRINEKIAELRLMRAMATEDAYGIALYSDFVYGSPKKDVFAFTWQKSVEPLLEKADNSNNELIKQIAEELRVLVASPDTTTTAELPALPEQGLIDQAAAQTRTELGDAIQIELPVGAEKFSDTQIQQLFTNAIHTLGIEGWSVTIEKGKMSISANQEKRQVQIPEGRTDTLQNIIGLIAHEIGTHALRRSNGERTKLQLLGLGLDRYEGGEEGVATMRETVVQGGVSDFAGAELYLAAGLARGLDGNDSSSKRDFRQTFEVLQRIEMLRELLLNQTKAKSDLAKESNASVGVKLHAKIAVEPREDREEVKQDLVGKKINTNRNTKIEAKVKTAEEIKNLADNRAWLRCTRIFRGTDCKTPGSIFTKDIIYREGNIAVWQLMSQDQDAMMRFSVGKFDPTNKRHNEVIRYVILASQTEITDNNLVKMAAIEAKMNASSPLKPVAA